jgi:nitrous oxide reductase accessory protein NosL
MVTVVFATDTFENWSKEAFSKPLFVQNGAGKFWCPVCGMSIRKFYKTSHTAKLKDGTNRQYCSMRCLVFDHKKHHIKPDSLKAVDNKTEKQIQVKDAFYVVGSDISGTMSKISKLPFSRKNDALRFIKEHGGRVKTFDKTFKLAVSSLQKDTLMTQKRKKKKIYKIGKKIFQKVCQKNINLATFNQINQLKASIKQNNLCGKKIKERELQIVSLYLWEVVRFSKLKQNHQIINITKNEKCPICGMFVYRYPRWVGQIFYKQKHLSFDGVKDLMKYYFNHKKGISKILVTDYYSQKAIDAKEAFYVTNSNIYGPMGNELIPFKNKKDAIIFKNDHQGKKIIIFTNIKIETIKKLD